MIGIIDLGLGNIKSVYNMLKYLGFNSRILTSKTDFNGSLTHIILPGIGHFDSVMKRISNIREPLEKYILDKQIPFLGICVGLQILGIGSEEGKFSGLGWLDFEVVKFKSKKIPHIGWNYIHQVSTHHLFNGITSPRFYFVHSFMIPYSDHSIALSIHDNISFVCAVNKENIYGVQFHPEKSHSFGMKLLTNFVEG